MRQYEFSEEQEQEIGKLAYYMRGVGVFLAGIGLLAALFGGFTIYKSQQLDAQIAADAAALVDHARADLLRQGAIQTIAGLLNLAIGVLFARASGSFKDIVETQGRDISHLMTALAKQRSAFFVQYVLILLALFLVVGVLLLGVILPSVLA